MSSDSVIMLRRNFKHTMRDPVSVFNAIFMPIIMMLMFVYVFGDAFNVGGGDYIDYAVPGMVMLALSYGLSATAVAVSSDMTKGIINRFKVMDVSRGAVLTGHVVSMVVRTTLAVAAIIGIAFLFGFSPSGTFVDWLAAAGVLLLVIFAVSWLTVAFGLAAKTVESAGFFAIVPADKMGPGVREFAEYQPFTSIIESIRGFFAGVPNTGQTLAAIAWALGITVIGYVWARSKFNKRA
jgi:ABC-2 type transport system permease protein